MSEHRCDFIIVSSQQGPVYTEEGCIQHLVPQLTAQNVYFTNGVCLIFSSVNNFPPSGINNFLKDKVFIELTLNNFKSIVSTVD